MYRRLIYLVPFVVGLGLGLTRSASGGLIGYWTFDENSGTIAADSSGQGNNGTIEGNALWVTGKMGASALNFDDSDDIVIIEDAPSLDVEEALTISLWVNTPEVANPNHMVTKQPSGTAPDNYPGNYEFRVKQDTIQFLHQTSEGTDYSEYHSISEITANEWHHAVVSITEGDTVEFYLDGMPAGSLPQLGAFGVLNDNSLRIGGRKDNHFFNGILDDVYIYNRVLSLNQIEGLGEGIEPTFYKAEKPSIADGAIYENAWVSLSWTPGDGAVSHDVYFGEDLNDVNDATHESETFRGNQTSAIFIVGFPGYPYPDGLVPGTTYYWRIDEVNDTNPDSPCKGYIWSFSIPPQTAYDPDPADGAEIEDPNNVTLSWTPGFGAVVHTVYFGDDFDEVNEATGGTLRGSAAYDPGVLELAKVYYWRVDEYDAFDTYKGEVWTFTTPGAVGNPQPANSATDVAMGTILSWTPADNVASHDLYIGTDKEVVRNADTNSTEYKGSVALGSESYDPGLFHWNTTYYWRVDEVASQSNPTKGPIWSFTTGNFLVIEDFESYTDDDVAGEAIWQTWIDGFGIADNGAQVGYLMPPYAEQSIVHSGAQSMPLSYTNEAGVTNSEAAMTLTALRDWTQADVAEMSLWFRGISANAAQPMYMAVSNAAGAPAVAAHDDPGATQISRWTQWIIPLQTFADQGINLTNVEKIAIGLGSKSGLVSSGGSGTMYFDDIRLYRPAP